MRFEHGIRRRLLAASALALGLLGPAGAALAQEATPTAAAADTAAPPPLDAREARIQALEEQIQALAAQVADLKSQTSNEIRAVRADAAALPTVSLANGRPSFATADGNFKFALRSVVQFDAAHYDVDPKRTDNDLASGTVFRRARLGFDGTAFKVWNFALWGEFGGSGGESPVLNQAFIEYAGFKPFGAAADPLRIRVGAWATPSGLEDATSNTDMLFLERAAIAEMVRSQAAGDGREGAGIFASGPRWYLSGVLTGKVAGPTSSAIYNQQEGFVTRAAFDVLKGPDYDVHLGGSIQGILKPVDTAAGAPVAQAITLSERPELRVDANSTRLVNTGAILADGETTYGLEAGASFKNFYVAGEWFKINVDRTAVGAAASPFDPSFSGWYVQGAFTLTGERHVWSSGSGGFQGVRPSKTFDLAKGTYGAFEIAARYSVLDLNDHEGVAGAAAPLGGIRGGKQSITTVGINWYPNRVLRFLLDYQWTNVDRLNATGADISTDENAVSLRSQFAF